MPLALSRLLALTGLVSGACAFAGQADLSYDEMLAKSRLDCAKASAEFPAHDRPPAAAPRCEADRFYYGIGRPVDYERARACAYASDDFGVLAMIYANGDGVGRSVGVARKAVCAMVLSPMETEMAMTALAQIEAARTRAAPRFDLCDVATSGGRVNYCADTRAALARQARDANFAHAASSWTPPARAAFERLQSRARDFIRLHDGEQEQGGTIGASLVVGEQEAQWTAFGELLAQAEAGTLPLASSHAAQEADARLNKTWAALKAGQDQDSGTIRMSDILAAQRAWLRYRDAWIAFGAVRFPGVPASAWVAELTSRREKELADVLFFRH